MKIYIAGMFSNRTMDRSGRLYCELMNDHERAIVDAVPYKLESFHYIRDCPELVHRERQRLFLDSGAFSAYTIGKTIDLEEYCAYIKDNESFVEICSVLDDLREAQKTYDNQGTMERNGTRPIPCFHFGEDERWLEWYANNYDYIALGGVALSSTSALTAWLDRVWSKYLCDASGRAKLKVHGFAVTSLPLMERYPWYSVDSSSWVQKGMFGTIYVPECEQLVLTVSSTSPARKNQDRHVDTLPGPQKRAVIAHVEKRGFDYERLRTVYVSRWVYNLQIFNEWNIQWRDKSDIFKLDQTILF